VDNRYCIVGHGLAGCTLALTFWQNNIPFIIYGRSKAGEASMASSGLITPVTGRKYVKSWMIDELLAAAIDFYEWSEGLFGKKYFFPVEIVRFLSHPEALIAWEKRSQDPEYAAYISQKKTEALDQLGRPYGIISGSYRLDTLGWLKAAWDHFRGLELLREEEFDPLQVKDFKGIIYATGAIPPIMSTGLIPNKGEALIVRMPDWKFHSVVKENVFFVPLEEDNIYWVGSYYDPWPSDPFPTSDGKHMLMKAIREVHEGSFTIIAHVSGVRPTVNDRRPLVGEVPDLENTFLFNGMGTKGTSLAPYWATKLVDHLTAGLDLPRYVLPERFAHQQ
jgi:glycine/D-amino acid oxidase-like deaminating enzyme